MKNEKEIRGKIEAITKGYKHVLDCGPATPDVNAPRTLMQTCAIGALDMLYWMLEEERPDFKCDNVAFKNL